MPASRSPRCSTPAFSAAVARVGQPVAIGEVLQSMPRSRTLTADRWCRGVAMTAREEWEEAYRSSPVRDADFETMSGIPVEPVYGPDDGEFPGVYPYTRGPYASMYRSKLWTMRMFAGYGTATETNQRFKDILSSGGTGLSTAF